MRPPTDCSAAALWEQMLRDGVKSNEARNIALAVARLHATEHDIREVTTWKMQTLIPRLLLPRRAHQSALLVAAVCSPEQDEELRAAAHRRNSRTSSAIHRAERVAA